MPAPALAAHARALGAGIAEILFLRGPWAGAVLLTMLVAQPGVLALGLCGVAAAYLFAHATRLGRDYLAYGFYSFNPLLAGLAVGYLFRPTPASALLAAAAGVMAFLLAWGLSHWLRAACALPVLSLPFVFVSWVVHLAAFRYAGLEPAHVAGWTVSLGLPPWLEGFLRTLGFIFFQPDPRVGLVVAALVLVHSRIMLALAAFGYAAGSAVHGLLLGSFALAWADPAAFNGVMAAMAVGGFYLLPSPASLLLAGLAAGLAAVLGDAVAVFWSAVGLPVHALPYNLVTLLLLYVLGLKGSPLLARWPLATPERTLAAELAERRRPGRGGRNVALPLAGRWTVWQGCDGPWTHQGPWRHAVDFLITDGDGRSFSGEGARPEDFHAWQQPVLSPVRGWVSAAVGDLFDGAIGSADHGRPWGNHVILYDERGFWVEISHFAQGSLAVKAGDRVEPGTLLGRCGNSGFSPQPHVHVQAQLSPELGAASVPFAFCGLRSGGELFAELMPATGAVVEPAIADPELARRLSPALDSELAVAVRRSGRSDQLLRLKVGMAPDGTLFFGSGRGRLYFSCDGASFVHHRLEGDDPGLAALFLALPRLPLAARPGEAWSDALPAGLLAGGLAGGLRLLAAMLLPGLAVAAYSGCRTADGAVEGRVSLPGGGPPLATRVSFAGTGFPALVEIGTAH